MGLVDPRSLSGKVLQYNNLKILKCKFLCQSKSAYPKLPFTKFFNAENYLLLVFFMLEILPQN